MLATLPAISAIKVQIGNLANMTMKTLHGRGFGSISNPDAGRNGAHLFIVVGFV
jgi:hypothetical protein